MVRAAASSELQRELTCVTACTKNVCEVRKCDDAPMMNKRQGPDDADYKPRFGTSIVHSNTVLTVG